MIPIVLSHTPAGSSTKQLLHYAQEVNSKKFRKYDYGLQNFVKYASSSPPEYDIKKITAPLALFYSSNDALASLKVCAVRYFIMLLHGKPLKHTRWVMSMFIQTLAPQHLGQILIFFIETSNNLWLTFLYQKQCVIISSTLLPNSYKSVTLTVTFSLE